SNRIRQKDPFGHSVHERKLCTVNRNAVERGQECCALTESAIELATIILLALCNVYMKQNSDRIANKNVVLGRQKFCQADNNAVGKIVGHIKEQKNKGLKQELKQYMKQISNSRTLCQQVST
ncbi:hypothetical protein ACLOJK_028314, partial [Asimina triloba]